MDEAIRRPRRRRRPGRVDHRLPARGRGRVGAARRQGEVPARQALRRRAHDARAARSARSTRRRWSRRRSTSSSSASATATPSSAARPGPCPHDAAAAARRVPARRGARARCRRRDAKATTIDRGERRRADVVVGADGANGTTARALGLGAGIVHGVAYEGNVPYGVVSRERYGRRAVVELADIPGGYGWVFAKGDHVNVGVGAWQSEGPKIREHLARVCAAHGLEPGAAREPARPPAAAAPARRRAIAGERALLVGDAAGLIDPVSGDGMYECFVSSRLAAGGDPRPARRPRRVARAVRDAPSTRRFAPLHRASWSSSTRSTAGRAPRGASPARSSSGGASNASCSASSRRPGEQHGLARIPLRALDVLGRT